jgi:signal transduction histidine kinase
MRERTQALGGTFTVMRRDPAGTLVQAAFTHSPPQNNEKDFN